MVNDALWWKRTDVLQNFDLVLTFRFHPTTDTRVAMDPNFEINTETHEGSATFSVPIVVIADAPAGAQNLNVNVRFQTCNDKNCLPPCLRH